MSGLLRWALGIPSAAAPAIAGFRIQTSVYGLPIPVVYGLARIAGNVIHMPEQPKAVQGGSGGKGGKTPAASVNYRAPLAIALCEGPIAGVPRFWLDKNAAELFSDLSSSYALFLGTATQSPWTFLTSKYPAQALTYQYTAYVAGSIVDFPNGMLPNYTWEVAGLLQIGGGNVDAHPSDVLTDLLTDPTHGLGWSSARLASWASFRAYCTAAGLFVSPAYTTQQPIATVVQDLLDAVNCAAVWSDGTLKVVPFADQVITGNSVTYTPNTTPLYDLNDDSFLGNPGEPPVTIVRKPGDQAYNQVLVNYESRVRDYAPDVAEAKDQSAIEQWGLRPAPSLSYQMLKSVDLARYVAQLVLQRAQNVRNTYTFRLSWKFALLEPMDLVTLTDAGLGLSFTPVRITEVSELADDAGVQIVAEDWPFGVASATRYPSQGGAGTGIDQGVDPGNTITPRIFLGPFIHLDDPIELWIAASGGTYWGGCEVWFSTDTITYYRVGKITSAAVYGVLSASIGTGLVSPLIDTVNTLAVDISLSSGTIFPGSASDAAALLTLCWMGGEFLTYQGATLTSAAHYTLTTLTRGLWGSLVAARGSGTPVVRCDENIFNLPFDEAVEGQTVYFKFPAFNIYGKALQDLSLLAPVSYTVTGLTAMRGRRRQPDFSVMLAPVPLLSGGDIIGWRLEGTGGQLTQALVFGITAGLTVRVATTSPYVTAVGITGGTEYWVDLRVSRAFVVDVLQADGGSDEILLVPHEFYAPTIAPSARPGRVGDGVQQDLKWLPAMTHIVSSAGATLRSVRLAVTPITATIRWRLDATSPSDPWQSATGGAVTIGDGSLTNPYLDVSTLAHTLEYYAISVQGTIEPTEMLIIDLTTVPSLVLTVLEVAPNQVQVSATLNENDVAWSLWAARNQEPRIGGVASAPPDDLFTKLARQSSDRQFTQFFVGGTGDGTSTWTFVGRAYDAFGNYRESETSLLILGGTTAVPALDGLYALYRGYPYYAVSFFWAANATITAAPAGTYRVRGVINGVEQLALSAARDAASGTWLWGGPAVVPDNTPGATFVTYNTTIELYLSTALGAPIATYTVSYGVWVAGSTSATPAAPVGTPSTPSVVAGPAGTGQVTATWSTPTAGYRIRVEWDEDLANFSLGVGFVLDGVLLVPGTTTHTVSNADFDSYVRCRARYENDAGVGTWSSYSNIVRPAARGLFF